MDITVDSRISGKTIREFCRVEMGFSSAILKKLKFSEGGILVNGSFVTVRYVLREGDILSLALEDTELDTSPYIIPINIPIETVYRDEALTVVNKPPNMPAHPSHGHREDTVANALAYQNRDKPYVFRPVNRLDRDTSGVMLVANSRLSAYSLYKSMIEGHIRKTYIAVLKGHLRDSEGVIESYMKRCDDSIVKREECEAELGKYARTEYKVIMESEEYTAVCAHPITGRTHQLRVHFASRNAPIAGDTLYGGDSPLISRQALHAATLEIARENGEVLRVKAPLPDDMTRLCTEVFEITKEEVRSIFDAL